MEYKPTIKLEERISFSRLIAPFKQMEMKGIPLSLLQPAAEFGSKLMEEMEAMFLGVGSKSKLVNYLYFEIQNNIESILGVENEFKKKCAFATLEKNYQVDLYGFTDVETENYVIEIKTRGNNKLMWSDIVQVYFYSLAIGKKPIIMIVNKKTGEITTYKEKDFQIPKEDVEAFIFASLNCFAFLENKTKIYKRKEVKDEGI